MTWTAPAVDRRDPAYSAPERAALEDWLRFHRQTLLTKCAGLTAEQLCRRGVAPSTMTLLGLIRHLREVERSWFLRGFLGLDAPPIYYSPENRDGDFDDIDPAHAEADYNAYLAEVADAERADAERAAAGRGLDELSAVQRDGADVDLRWIYLHLIEEYARHNGHADLIRQCIDGAVGE